jgi:SNF2 family DNA or RNA helicase
VPQLPSTLQAELRDYQREGFEWLARLAHWGVGACLADDMGLGKTLQALALLLARAPGGPALVVAPTSVCMNWISEAARFAPTLKVKLFGPGDRAQMLDELEPFDLVVVSYGLLQLEAPLFVKPRWHTIVLDEAQAIKNAHTRRSQAVMALQGDFRMVATGTPLENHLGELWNLFRFINPGLLGTSDQFNLRFAGPIERAQDKRTEAAARARLRRLIQPFILRRTKAQVLAELPPRTEIVLPVELSEEETALYESLRREALDKLASLEAPQNQKAIQILAEMMKLRRACCNPELVAPGAGIASSKLAAFARLAGDLLENRHKVLVFSQFVDHLSLIRKLLDERGVRYQYLDGSTPMQERKKRVDAFQAGDGDVFLISLKAGGVGINLTAADYVIHMDPWWNPAVEDQASDRAHRMGQQRPVTIYRLVARHTIEEGIVDLHKHKRDLADSLLEGSDVAARMSPDDMMAMLQEGLAR